MSDLYEKDFYGWTVEQANLLRTGKMSEVDMDHLIEEIESMGASERSELRNRLIALLAHLLKWVYQPERRSRSWSLTVAEQRVRIDDLMDGNPSLRPKVQEVVTRAYRAARFLAARETGIDLSMFPEICPWTFDQAMALPVDL